MHCVDCYLEKYLIQKLNVRKQVMLFRFKINKQLQESLLKVAKISLIIYLTITRIIIYRQAQQCSKRPSSSLLSISTSSLQGLVSHLLPTPLSSTTMTILVSGSVLFLKRYVLISLMRLLFKVILYILKVHFLNGITLHLGRIRYRCCFRTSSIIFSLQQEIH